MRRPTRGITLVELLVSISIGLVVAGAMVALYIGTARSYRQLEALAQLQSTARYVFEIMGYDIRMAGNTGCHVPRKGTAAAVANFVNSYSLYWWSNTDQTVRGFEETVDSNAIGDAEFPQTAPGDFGSKALRGDSIVVLRANTEENLGVVGNYDLGPATISFNDPSGKGFKQGSLLMLSDCSIQTALFHKTGGSDTGPIQHKTNGSNTASNPGNCDNQLTGLASTTPGICPTSGSTQAMSGAKLLPLSANAYYLRNSGRQYANGSNIPSLYRQTLTTSNGLVATEAQELVSGVTDLQVLYGVDTSTTPDNIVDTYMTAAAFNSAGFLWTERRVLAVRLTITLESPDDSVANESTSFTLGNGSVITDRRLRRSYTMTFGIRQRLS